MLSGLKPEFLLNVNGSEGLAPEINETAEVQDVCWREMRVCIYRCGAYVVQQGTNENGP